MYSYSGTAYDSAATLWHVGTSTRVQAAKLPARYAVSARLCWPSSWVSGCPLDASAEVYPQISFLVSSRHLSSFYVCVGIDLYNFTSLESVYKFLRSSVS